VVVALADGVLIGSCIVLLMLANGRIAGISGIVGDRLSGEAQCSWP
jgi:uncharacterized membrane protein YedE/YeeE